MVFLRTPLKQRVGIYAQCTNGWFEGPHRSIKILAGRRLRAGRYIHAALQSPLLARYGRSRPPLRMAVSWILQICCSADHPLFTPREGPSGGIAKKLTASQLTAER